MNLKLPRIRNPLDYVRPRTLRIGVTGLARSGKTVLLTSLAATLLAPEALGGRIRASRLAPAGAASLPRFEQAAHLASLAADPPRWPARTNAVSLLAIELELGTPTRRLRLELLDYPGEWLLDLPLIGQSFERWSTATLARLQQPELAEVARDFLAFSTGLPAAAALDEALAEAGHRLYRATLVRLRDQAGLSMLQPGRFLMPAPGASAPWERFFPTLGHGGLQRLLAQRYDAYVRSVRDALVSPLFGEMDRLVVLADLLPALHTGAHAFDDARAALAASAAALRWRGSWLEAFTSLVRLRLPPRVIRRVAYAATKSDHVAERQRGNLAALMGRIAQTAAQTAAGTAAGTAADTAAPGGPRSAAFAIAAARCTEDFVWTLDGHPVSAVRGRVLGERQFTRSYPGEVPDSPPDASFWTHPFLDLPAFEPVRLPQGGRAGIPNIGIPSLLGFLLEDVL